MSKRSSKKRRRTLPALGLASVSLSMASGACAVIGEANASTPPQQTHEIFLAEEEISDVSLATFYVFNKERPSPLQLARGGCGGGGGGCGHGGGCHGGGGGCGCHAGCAGCAHAGCAGGCHVGCAGGCAHMGGYAHMGVCHMGGCHGCGGCHGRRFFFGGCVGCAGGCGGCGGGCGGDTCWIWTPFGWIYSCSSNATPTSEG
jgi:hypothetical protein